MNILLKVKCTNITKCIYALFRAVQRIAKDKLTDIQRSEVRVSLCRPAGYRDVDRVQTEAGVVCC